MTIEEILLLFLFLLLLLLLLIVWLWRWRPRVGNSNILQVGSYTVNRQCDGHAADIFSIHTNHTAAYQTLTLIVVNTGKCDINLFSKEGSQMPAKNIGLAPPGGNGSATVTVRSKCGLLFGYTCSAAEIVTSPCTGTITTNLHL
ncbi:MAG: hypothetical protein ACYSWZ_07415 [Planctomycetota bacterium]|jgi:hypothetical protein